MKKAEKVIAILSIIGLGLNLLLVPGGGVLTILALSALAILYMYFSIGLFVDIRRNEMFKKDSYKGISTRRIVGTVALGVNLSITAVGILFKLQSWPGSSLHLITGLTGLLIITIIGTIRYLKTKSEFYPRIFKRVAVIGALGLIFLLVPSTTWLDIKYRNHPAYLDALKQSMADPENKELWYKMKEERQKMIEEQ